MVATHSGSVVKVHCSGAAPNYAQPWQMGEQENWSGSAFAMNLGSRWALLTNAHVVTNALTLYVTRQGCSTKRRCYVIAIAHDLDLAIVGVDDKMFQQAVPALTFTHVAPSLFADVHVMGYPEGGATLCMTKGASLTNTKLSSEKSRRLQRVHGWSG